MEKEGKTENEGKIVVISLKRANKFSHSDSSPLKREFPEKSPWAVRPIST